MSPSAKVEAFEEAVREELLAQQPNMIEGEVSIKIFLWRQLGKGIKQADATNMQKAIEDAMQGIVILNDRNVRSISTEIMEQNGFLDEPRIMINVAPYSRTVLPSFMYEEWFRPKDTRQPDNTPHYTDGAF
jgi:Holliday junction resolvase RusA-like endonuclease